MTAHDLLFDIRTELRAIRALLQRAPLPAMPYEQLAALMGRDAGPTMGVTAARGNLPAGSDVAQTAPAARSMDGLPMGAMPLPPARPAGSCKSVDDRPDPVSQPGAINPDVTPENMATTIFVRGWTATVRPPVSFTNALKQQQMGEYGLSGPLSDYEEDHIVPLECGGAPHDAANLWPQKREGQWGARVKDLTENAANAALRSGAMTLQEVQDGFRTNWKDLHIKLFRNPKIVASMMAMAMEPPADEP